MVRTKLKQLKESIQPYLGIPYWRNKLKNGHIVEEGFAGGKGNAEDIAKATIKLAQKKKVDLLQLTNQEIYNFQKKNKIGIDCSGLVCQLLFSLGKINHKTLHLNPRRTSADMLTSPSLSQKVNNSKDIQTGDLIRFREGKHVMFIVEINTHHLTYLHNSEITQIHGVHYGTVEIKPTQINFSLINWSDTSLTSTPYANYYHPENGDGVYRLKYFL